MKQMTFADAEYAGKRKQTRKELFLIEMDRVVQQRYAVRPNWRLSKHVWRGKVAI